MDAEEEEEGGERAGWSAVITAIPVGGGEGYFVHSCLMRRGKAEEEPTPQQLYRIGMEVEIQQEEAGYEGSFYSADLLEIDGEKAHVQYHAFDEEETGGVVP